MINLHDTFIGRINRYMNLFPREDNSNLNSGSEALEIWHFFKFQYFFIVGIFSQMIDLNQSAFGSLIMFNGQIIQQIPAESIKIEGVQHSLLTNFEMT